MILAFVVIGIIFLVFLTIWLLKLNFKLVSVVLFLSAFVASTYICMIKPQMHKPFSIDIIEYIMKINDDGSMSTIKQVTTTVIKQNDKDLENNEKDY